MAMDVQAKISKRKTWTGKQLGKLFLEYVVDRYTCMRKGEPAPEQSGYIFRVLYDGDYDNKQRQDYLKYVQMVNWLGMYRLKCEAYIQQGLLRWQVIAKALNEALNAEAILRYTAQGDVQDTAALREMKAAIMTEDLAERGDAAAVGESYEIFRDSYYYIHGYNYAVDRITAIYKVDVSLNKRNIEGLNTGIADINAGISKLEAILNAEDYADTANRQKKLDALHQIFPRLDVGDIVDARDQHAQEIDTLLKDGASFDDAQLLGPCTSNAQRLNNLLFFRGE